VQAGIAVDDAQQGGLEAARDEILQAPLPRLERLAAAQVQGEQLLLAIGEHGYPGQHWHSLHPAGPAHPEHQRVEIEVDDAWS
jgi:hypothetical protein